MKPCSTCGNCPAITELEFCPDGDSLIGEYTVKCPMCGKSVVALSKEDAIRKWDELNTPVQLKLKLLDPVCKPTRSGNWIDCYSREEIHYEAGECKRIPLGFCVSIGKGKEMLLAARSSFFGKTGGIQTNAPGVIDEEYCGDDDEVLFSVYFTKSGVIYKGQKIAQFRIIDKMPEVKFEYVEKMNAPSRGGFGSTGN